MGGPHSKDSMSPLCLDTSRLGSIIGMLEYSGYVRNVRLYGDQGKGLQSLMETGVIREFMDFLRVNSADPLKFVPEGLSLSFLPRVIAGGFGLGLQDVLAISNPGPKPFFNEWLGSHTKEQHKP